MPKKGLMPLKRIVVIGPESTGKSTLCEQLAAHYHTGWVPEFAREFLTTHGTAYRYEDLLTIAKGQIALEDRMAEQLQQAASLLKQQQEVPEGAADDLLFIDTDLYVMKVWSEFVFGKCDPWILEQILARKYDGYLLCRTDLPWTADELREYPDPVTRERLFHIYKDCLVNQNTPWSEIGGQSGERLEGAIAAVNRLIS
jgi:NadR type nicotinamide-nucleotide adenylyltransferase